MALVETIDAPPQKAGASYKIPALSGEIIYIPLSKSATRLVVTGKETDGAFAIVTSGGSQSDPIGFHFHREAHDLFLCLQGKMNVWAGDECRTMEPGDFASVPPGTVHQYQILGEHTEFVGLIFPGGWEEFFRFIGEPYSGPLWPMEDGRDFFEILLPKLKAAAERFDMVPQPQIRSFDPQPWQASDATLPAGKEPYFLKHAKGPAYIAEGTLTRPLITTKQSGGHFTIGSIESSGMHRSALFQSAESIKFDVHHAFQVVEGKVRFKVGEEESDLTQWETLFVPAHTSFSFRTIGHASKMYAFSSGCGVLGLLTKIGQAYGYPVLPEKEVACKVDAKDFSQELGFVLA